MRFRPKKIRGSSKAGAPAHRGGWCWAAALRVQAWMVGVDSPGCRVDGRTTCDRRAHSRIASAGRLHSAAPAKFQRLPRAKNEILKKGSQTRSGGLRATREQGRCEGCVSAHSTRLSHSVTFDRVCLVGAGNQHCSRQDRRTWQRSLAGACCGSWRRSLTTRAS